MANIGGLLSTLSFSLVVLIIAYMFFRDKINKYFNYHYLLFTKKLVVTLVKIEKLDSITSGSRIVIRNKYETIIDYIVVFIDDMGNKYQFLIDSLEYKKLNTGMIGHLTFYKSKFFSFENANLSDFQKKDESEEEDFFKAYEL